jgi:hypothetical protein
MHPPHTPRQIPTNIRHQITLQLQHPMYPGTLDTHLHPTVHRRFHPAHLRNLTLTHLAYTRTQVRHLYQPHVFVYPLSNSTSLPIPLGSIAPTPAPLRFPALRPWRPIKLPLPVFQLHRPEARPLNWDKLLWPAEPIAGMYQRRDERLDIPGGAVRVSARGHGDPHRRPTEPEEFANESKYPSRDAVAC